VHFRTDASFLAQHQAQLQETHHLIQIARTNDWRRQAEMNEKVAAHLERIIAAVEEPNHDA
jgi:integrase/recombinase XerD